MISKIKLRYTPSIPKKVNIEIMTPQTLKSYNELLVALFLIYLFYLMS